MLFLACIVHSFWFAARSLLRFPGSAVVTNPPVKQETWVQFLGQKDPLEKEMTTHSNIVAWEISIDTFVKAGKVDVVVYPTESEWYGVTYKEDKPWVVNAIQALIDAGEYPEHLWG